MPTASTSQILGNTESFEPLTSNFYVRRVLTGEYYVVNRILQNILKGIHLWDEKMNEQFILEKGSIQKIQRIPGFLKNIFRTVWEIPQKVLLDLAVIRNKYVDQSQSLNVYHKDAKYSKISSALVYAWKNGLKTGSYYTRTKSKLSKNKKLSASDNEAASTPKRPENSMFTCAGGGCDA